MKKLILTLVTLVTATAASAQIVLWNGDGKETGSDGGFWNRSTPTVVVEDGNKCLKITLADATNDWERHNVGLPLGSVDLKGLRRISLRIKMPDTHNVLVKLGKDGAYTLNRYFWYGEANTWQRLVFEYSEGTDNEKVVDTGNTVLEIWPYEGYDALNNGKEVFIDDIQLEGPVLKDGAAIRTLADDALSGNIAITGTLSKGKYQITWDGDWHMGDYDDYVLLNSKLSNTITSVDIKGATVSDFDGNQFFFKNPNNIVYATSEYGYSHNIVAADKTTTKLILDDAHPLAIPTGFTAASVELKRGLKNGINTLCLPFEVTPSEVKSTKIATFKGGVTFTTAESVAANTPFITVDATEVSKVQGMTFSNKTIATVTNDIVGTTFQGIYAPKTSTANKYGINSAGKIQEGAADIKCNAFRAWLTTIPASARSIDIDGETTGISNVSLENPVKEIYNLNGVRVNKIGNKGIYIINGKKVIVK